MTSMKTFYCFALSVFVMSVLGLNSLSYAVTPDVNLQNSQINGSLDFDEIKVILEAQQQEKINNHNKYYQEFIKSYNDSKKYISLKVDDLVLSCEWYSIDKERFNNTPIPENNAVVEFDESFSFLDVPSEYKQTAAFYMHNIRVRIKNPDPKAAKKFRFPDFYRGGYNDLFVIYSNEISTVTDAAKLVYALASNSPSMKGQNVKSDRYTIRANIKNFLRRNYFYDCLMKEPSVQNVQKADINNYKYRYFIVVERSAPSTSKVDLTYLRRIQLFTSDEKKD